MGLFINDLHIEDSDFPFYASLAEGKTAWKTIFIRESYVIIIMK